MTKLTTERLEQFIANPLGNSLYRTEQMDMARQLLAYEQADKTTDLKTLVISEIVDFYSGFESPCEPETVDEAQRQLIGRIEKVFGLAAPVLPKQPELLSIGELLHRLEEQTGEKWVEEFAQPVSEPYKLPDGYLLLPQVPTQAHLNSIAMRYRHDFYLLNDAQKQGALAVARQMYEECSGQGFYTVPAAPVQESE